MKNYVLLVCTVLFFSSCNLLSETEPEEETFECVPSTDLQVVNITETTAVAVWDNTEKAGEGPDYTVEYGLSGFNVGDGLTSDVTKFEDIIIIELTPATEYQAYVRTDCGEGRDKFIIGPFDFMTD